jgi:hypothetical protein
MGHPSASTTRVWWLLIVHEVETFRPPRHGHESWMAKCSALSPAIANVGETPTLLEISMPEMAEGGEDHGHARGVGGGDDFFIADGTTGLNAGGGPGVDG